MDKEKVTQFLDKLDIEYDLLQHPAAVTDEAIKYLDENLPSNPCKNLFLVNRQGTEFYLLMMPRNKDFRTKYIKEQLGLSHLSFAKEEHMVEKLDVHPGSVSVMGLMNDKENRVQLLMDRDLLQEEYLGCHPCINTSSIKLTTKDLLEKFLPAVHHEAIYVDI